MAIRNDHIAIVVQDLDDLVKFYTEVVGLTLNKMVRNPNVAIAYLGGSAEESQLELLEFVEERELGLKHFCYEITDLEGTCAKMAEQGVEFFIGPKMHDDGSGWLAFFKDPEGNVIELVEPGVLAMEPGLFPK